MELEAPGVESGVGERGLAGVDGDRRGLEACACVAPRRAVGLGSGGVGDAATLARVALERGDLEAVAALLRLLAESRRAV